MSCIGIVFLALVVFWIGAFMVTGLIGLNLGLLILALILTPMVLLYTWRIIYPWLVRMGRWAAQLRNSFFLLFLLGIGFAAWYIILPQLGIQLPGILWWVLLGVAIFFIFLLLLAIVVWIVRVWRRSWPLGRNFFWDIGFRIVALFWKILVGIPLGIAWFLYHPPLRWLIAAFLFYLRGLAAAAAWLLYNPPLRSMAIALLFVTRLIGRVIAWLLYNPPIRWVIQFGLFLLRLMARPISTVIYWIDSWWPITGVQGTLEKGLNTESKSYQDYKYA
jgi:hypothetical protein